MPDADGLLIGQTVGDAAAEPGRRAVSLTFEVDGSTLTVEPEAVIVAGFTGRDSAAVEAHLAELEALGVPVPASAPTFYPAPPGSAVQAPAVAVTGGQTSGEAEAVVVVDGDRTWLTLGSDHTDRAAEAVDIALSKLVCPKPVAAQAWPLTEVADHLDQLEITSWIDEGGVRTLYQQGRLGELIGPAELIEAAPFARRPDRFVLFTGTFAAVGGVRPSPRFEARLHDPVLGRSIGLAYNIDVIDVLEGSPP